MKKLAPLDGKTLVKIITSPEFAARLTKAASITWKSDCETAFCIGKKIDDTLLYGSVIGQDMSLLEACEPTEGINGVFPRSIKAGIPKTTPRTEEIEFYDVLSLHFHPHPSIASPSDADIESLLSERETKWGEDEYSPHVYDNLHGAITLAYKPIMAIASFGPNGDKNRRRALEVILFQETEKEPLTIFAAERITYGARTDPEYRINDNNGVTTAYNKQPGIRAALLHFTPQGRSYVLREEDREKIARFASQPKILHILDY